MSNDICTTAGVLAVPPREAAPLVGVTGQTLKRWRAKGIGPAYVRLDNGQVRYRICDLDAYLAANVVTPGSPTPQQD